LKSITKVLTKLSLLGLFCGVAAATTLDFEDITSNNFDTPIVSNGFSFDFSGGWFIGPEPLGAFNSNGTSRLVTTANTTILMQAADSHIFTLSSLFAATGSSTGTGTIQLTGNLDGGGTVSQTLNVTSDFTSFTINPSFTNLSSVTFLTSSTGGGLDNLLVDGAAAAPEPASLMLVGIGVAVCALHRRKKRA